MLHFGTFNPASHLVFFGNLQNSWNFETDRPFQAMEKLVNVPANSNIGFLLKYWLIAVALLHLSAPSKIAKTMARHEHESSMAS
jgi:hypothetical protein